MVTLPASALGLLMSASEAVVAGYMHGPEGYPLGANGISLVDAIDVAARAILEAR
jgi:hypothetical protein